MKIIGEKEKVAFGIGEYLEGSIQNQRIDMWVMGRHITSFDNAAYLPTYHTALQREINKLEAKELTVKGIDYNNDFEVFSTLHETDENRILSYDITLNEAMFYAIENGNKYKIVFSFLDERHEPKSEIGKVFTITIEKQYLLSLLKQVIGLLSSKWV